MDELGLPGGVLAKKWEDAYAGRDAEPRPSFMRYLGFFGEEKLVPLTPEAYREILTRGDDIEIPTGIKKGLAPLLGDGLVLAEGARHDVSLTQSAPAVKSCPLTKTQFLKKLAGPSFTPSQQRALVPTMWTVALKLNEKIKALVGSGADAKADINMFEWTNRVTFDMIFTTAWGKGTLASTFNSLENTGGFYAVHDRNVGMRRHVLESGSESFPFFFSSPPKVSMVWMPSYATYFLSSWTGRSYISSLSRHTRIS